MKGEESDGTTDIGNMIYILRNLMFIQIQKASRVYYE